MEIGDQRVGVLISVNMPIEGGGDHQDVEFGEELPISVQASLPTIKV